jgi:hypothetical protein
MGMLIANVSEVNESPSVNRQGLRWRHINGNSGPTHGPMRLSTVQRRFVKRNVLYNHNYGPLRVEEVE